MRLGFRFRFVRYLLICITTILTLWWLRHYQEFQFGKVSSKQHSLSYKDIFADYINGKEEEIPDEHCTSSIGDLNRTADFTTSQILDKITTGANVGQDLTSFRHTASADKSYANVTLEVVVIPHSHNDPGWLKTYMEYFNEDTTHILTNIVNKLRQYPECTFVWVESCFLDVWWKDQSSETREAFKSLVQNGQLEIVSGMWVAPDEATTHYYSLLDQMIEGHYWIKNNLGIVPETSLNFDQFGYSATVPYLAKKAGIKRVMIKRTYRRLKEALGSNRWMTFNWRQFWDPDGHDDISGHVEAYEFMSISDSCGPSRDICNELDFTIRPDLPNPGSQRAKQRVGYRNGRPYANLHELVKAVVGQMKLKAKNYEQKVMLMPHGGDFYYKKADDWDKQFRNMKLFIDYVNERKDEFNVHMKFGTLKDYYNILEEQIKKYSIKFPVVSGDFYSYTEGNNFWTGYFTTRMFDKRLSREVQESLRASELFSAIIFQRENGLTEGLKRDLIKRLVEARQNLGVFMHHDAITGTEKAYVAVDYEHMLSSAFSLTQDVLASAINNILFNDPSVVNQTRVKSLLKRINHASLTEATPIVITPTGTYLVLVNSLTQRRHELISVPIASPFLSIEDNHGRVVDVDIIQDGPTIKAEFPVNFPPLSVLVYTIREEKERGGNNGHTNEVKPQQATVQSFTCQSSQFNVTFNLKYGTPEKVCISESNSCEDVRISWLYYRSRSGAYSMLSSGTKRPADISQPQVTVTSGKHTCRVKVKYKRVEVEYSLPKTDQVMGTALRIDVKTDLPRNYDGDLAMEVETRIDSGKSFYTDSNGMQMMQRKFRDRMPFGGNVYPITSLMFIEGTSKRLILHSAQPHGVTSATSGLMTIYVARVGTMGEMGMPEPVRDSKPTKTSFLLQLESTLEYGKIGIDDTRIPSIHTVFLNDLLQHPIYSLVSLHESVTVSQKTHTFLRQPLPCDVILANVKNLADVDYNINGTSVTLFRRGIACSHKDVCPLFDPMNIKPGQLLGKKSWKGQKSTEMYLSHLMVKDNPSSTVNVNIKPFDIRTFHLTDK